MKKIFALTGLLSCIVVTGCTPAPEVTVHTQSSSAATQDEAFDRDPCELWQGSFGWFDPNAADNVGVSAGNLYATLCPNNKPGEKSKAAFCAKLHAGLRPEDPAMMEVVLCGKDLCEDLRGKYCSSSPSDQSAWVQEYAVNHGCDVAEWSCSN